MKIKNIILMGTTLNFSYIYYNKNQTYYNLVAFKRSLFNILITSKVFTFSAIDYLYNLKGMDDKSELYEKIQNECHTRCAKRILNLAEKSKGIYLKAGQHIGNLEKIVPKEFIEVLKVLQDSAKPMEFSAVEVILKENLGKNWEEKFINIDKEAIASASIAQVHKGILKENNQEVAIKIQYPNLKYQFGFDIRIIKRFSKLVDFVLRNFKNKDISFFKVFEKFEKSIINEIDFSEEINNSIKLKEFLKNDNNYIIPKVYNNYSNNRCIIMDFVYGNKINDLDNIKDKKRARYLLISLMSKMIFRFGHIHCDPHPGNILVNEENGKTKLILLDHGFYRTFTEEFKNDYVQLYESLLLFDDVKLKMIAEKYGIGEHYKYLPLLLMFRTRHTKKLGDLPTKEDRKKLSKQNLVGFEKINQTIQKIPTEIMLIMRASNLMGLRNIVLGGNFRDVIIIYSQEVFKILYGNSFTFYFKYFSFRFKLFLFENLRYYFSFLFKIKKEVI